MIKMTRNDYVPKKSITMSRKTIQCIKESAQAIKDKVQAHHFDTEINMNCL